MLQTLLTSWRSNKKCTIGFRSISVLRRLLLQQNDFGPRPCHGQKISRTNIRCNQKCVRVPALHAPLLDASVPRTAVDGKCQQVPRMIMQQHQLGSAQKLSRYDNSRDLPSSEWRAPIQRIATVPRDIATSILLLLYCSLSVAEMCVAFAVVLVSGVHYQQNHTCLLSYMPNGKQLCSFTYVVSGLTAPLAAGVMVTELLPDRLVTPGVRNLVPLALWTVGIALWGVAAGAIHERSTDHPAEGWWRRTLEQLAWCNMSLFLIGCCIKLLSPVLEPCIDSSSICMGRLCPDGCMPACDACCCLNVNTAKVPREVFRHGQVVERYMMWNQELVTSSALPEVVQPMSR